MKYSLWVLVLVLSISVLAEAENIYDESDLKDGDDFEFVNEVRAESEILFVFKTFLRGNIRENIQKYRKLN